MHHWSVVIVLAGTGKVDRSCTVGQSDTQGEQLHSGLVAPWIAEFEGVHRARHSHCPAVTLHEKR